MTARDDAHYRLRLAEGFFEEAKQDFELKRWRSCVDNSQLAVENSGKAILAIFGPVSRTHEPGKEIEKLIQEKKIDESLFDDLNSVLPCFDEMGLEEHFRTDYGSEEDYIIPWDLFDEEDALKAKSAAESCLQAARKVCKFYFPSEEN